MKVDNLGGGALPNMEDKDTDADIVIVKSKKSFPDSSDVAKYAPLEGYQLLKIVSAKKL